MKTIRIKNLRGLQDTGDIELKPITMLVGANSSGKSTFLRTFPLFKQGGTTYKQGPILWYGPEVDFGSYNEALRKGSKNMEFSFSWDAIDRSVYFIDQHDYIKNVKCTIGIDKKDEDESYVDSVRVEMEDCHVIQMSITKGGIMKVTINDINCADFEGITIVRQSGRFILPYFEMEYEQDDSFLSRFPYRKLATILSRLPEFHKKVKNEVELLPYCPSVAKPEEMLQETCAHYRVRYNEKVLLDDTWHKYCALAIMIRSREILLAIDKTLQQEMGNVYYIKPFRASAERYYRQQNLAVRNLDSDGHNMAMFVANMYKSKKAVEEFQTWTRKYFKFELRPERIEGHVSLQIRDKLPEDEINAESREWRNITDLGFGYSQILPVILTLWQIISQKKSTRDRNVTCFAAYEQPELHLHPKMQAELMDAIVATVKIGKQKGIDVKVIIETHSQVMINRLGLRIALDSDFSEEMASVLLFDEDNETCNPRRASYTKDGHLTNWPIGFFEPDLN